MLKCWKQHLQSTPLLTPCSHLYQLQNGVLVIEFIKAYVQHKLRLCTSAFCVSKFSLCRTLLNKFSPVYKKRKNTFTFSVSNYFDTIPMFISIVLIQMNCSQICTFLRVASLPTIPEFNLYLFLFHFVIYFVVHSDCFTNVLIRIVHLLQSSSFLLVSEQVKFTAVQNV